MIKNKYKNVKLMGWIFTILLFLGTGPVATPLVLAQTNDVYKRMQWPFYDPNDGTSDGSSLCLSGPAGSGPLYGPFFPKISDTAELANRIRDYIKSTRPDSPLWQNNLPEKFVSEGIKNNVNPVMVVGIAQKDTSLATAGYGRPPKYNFGNIRGDSGDGTGFRSFANYPEAIQKTTEHLAGENYLGPPANLQTVAEVISTWAPPSDHNDTPGYIRFVNELIRKLLNGMGSNGEVDPDTSSICGGNTGTVSAEGYAFPVAPQRKSQNGGVNGMSALPCTTSSCHHDGTAAFDISRKPGGDAIAGTPVYAISDGSVDMVHLYNNIPGCFSLQLHSSKDNYWYWYGHLQKPLVKSGDSVKAGQQVAEIGVRKCTGNGSDSHLHIDRGCVKDGVPQKGGLESCRDPGMIGVINALWETLPN